MKEYDIYTLVDVPYGSTIYYGIANNKIDVTHIANKRCRNGNHIIITTDDHQRAAIFGDPIPYVVKSIFVETNNIVFSDFIEDNEINKNLKISIIMGYYNRKDLLTLTLDGFQRLYAGTYNFEVVIADDLSNSDNTLRDTINAYTFPIKLIEITEKTHINPVIAYNTAITHISADTDIVIIQNPEIFHTSDIIRYTIRHLTPSQYFAYPVFASPSADSNSNLQRLFQEGCSDYYNEYICKTSGIWYNHIIHHNRKYHFLTAIYKSDLDRVGGFNNDMKDGIDFDDNEFLYRVSCVCDTHTIDSNIYMGIHQWHPSSAYNRDNVDTLRNNNLNIYNNSMKNNIIYKDPNFNIKKNIIMNL